MKKRLKAYLRDLISGWQNRWRMMSWPARARLIAKTLWIATGLISIVWLLVYYVLGPASVNIGDVEVDLDRSLSLAGPDKNANGIRDDIDNYIEVLTDKKKYGPVQVKAIEQDARATQMLVTVDLSDAKAVRAVDEVETRAINCLFDQLGNDADKILAQIEKMTANTKHRVLAYIKFSHAMNGTVSIFPKNGEGCDK